MGYYYDINGQPLELMEWVRLFEDMGYRRVGDDAYGGVRVSTVWLGIDHSWGFSGGPLIFETMVFGGDFDGEMNRYVTLEQARAGHQAWCEKLFLSSVLGKPIGADPAEGQADN